MEEGNGDHIDKEKLKFMDKERFWRAKAVCDTRAMADVLLAEQDALLVEDVPMEESPLVSKDVLLLESRQAIRRSDPQRASQYADAWLRIVMEKGCVFWIDYFKCQGDAAALAGDDEKAIRNYAKYCAKKSTDADLQVNFGNALCRLGRIEEARDHYASAMNILKNPGDCAAHNFMLTLGTSVQTDDRETQETLRRIPWNEMMEAPPSRELPEISFTETFQLPIFINCRDRLGCLQQLVDWLLAAGYRRIYLLDNASTYPPLRAYYEKICKHPCVTIVQIPENLGYQALWRSGILHQLDIRTPYVYTDPDVVPTEECPTGIVARLYRLLQRYPFLDKAGMGLKMDDVPPEVDLSLERAYYHVPREEQVFFAPCDTTFALYKPLYHYTNFMSLRTGGRMMLRHLPWYLDREHLPEDEQYYVAHANDGSTFAREIKGKH